MVVRGCVDKRMSKFAGCVGRAMWVGHFREESRRSATISSNSQEGPRHQGGHNRCEVELLRTKNELAKRHCSVRNRAMACVGRR